MGDPLILTVFRSLEPLLPLHLHAYEIRSVRGDRFHRINSICKVLSKRNSGCCAEALPHSHDKIVTVRELNASRARIDQTTYTASAAGRIELAPDDERHRQLAVRVVNQLIRSSFPMTDFQFRGYSEVFSRSPVATSDTHGMEIWEGCEFSTIIKADGMLYLILRMRHLLVLPLSRGILSPKVIGGKVLQCYGKHTLTVMDFNAEKGTVLCQLRSKTFEEDPNRLLMTLDPETIKKRDPHFSMIRHALTQYTPARQFENVSKYLARVNPLPQLQLGFEENPVRSGGEWEAWRFGGANLVFAGGIVSERQPGRMPKAIRSQGLYRLPDELKLAFFFPSSKREEAKKIYLGLRDELAEIKPKPIMVPLERTVRIEYDNDSQLSIQERIKGQGKSLVGIVLVPPEGQDIPEDVVRLRRSLRSLGIPHKQIQWSRDLSKGSHSCLNVALDVIYKAGGLPWRIHHMPGMTETDCFIGIDIGYGEDQDISTAVFILLDCYGRRMRSTRARWPRNERIDTEEFRKRISYLLRYFTSRVGQFPLRIVIHRDGRYFEELEALTAVLESLRVPSYDLVAVIKSGVPIMAVLGQSQSILSPPEGSTVIFDNTAWLVSSNKSGRMGNSPVPIQVVHERGDGDIRELAEQVYWLCQVYDGSVFNAYKLPITTRLADRYAGHPARHSK